MQTPKGTYDPKDDIKTSFKRGLDLQREAFKAAKHENNFDNMCDAVENIKSEIRDKCIKRDYKKSILFVEKIIDDYRNKEQQFTRNTPDGPQIIFPPNIYFIMNKNLTRAYEVLIKLLEVLDLL